MEILRLKIPKPLYIHEADESEKKTSLFHYIWSMSGWRQVFVCVVAVMVAMLSLAPLELQRLIINEAVASEQLSQIYILGGVYLGVILALQVLKFAFRMYQGWLSESAIIRTRARILNLYRKKSPRKDHGEAGQAIVIVGGEVDKLGGFVGEGLSGAAANAAMLLGVASYMIIVEATIALFSLLFLIPQIVLTPIVQRRLNRLLERRIHFLRDLGDDISEINRGRAEYCLEDLPKIYRNRIKFYATKFALRAALNVLNVLAPLSVLIYGGSLVFSGEVSVGVIVAFLSGFERMSQPIHELIAFYRVAAQASVQHELISDWMQARPEDAIRTD